MQLYKNYRVYTTAVCTNGAWNGRGIALNARANINRQLKCINSELLFLNKQDAEAFAYKLRKRWLDGEKNH